MVDGKVQKRVTRPRRPDVTYIEPIADAPTSSRVPYQQHASACLSGNFGKLKPLGRPGDLNVDFLRGSGFHDPVLVHTEESVSANREALGMSVPEGLSPAYIAAALGPDTRVPTIDVESQTSGPRMTLAEWAQYYESSGKERLLNVVSLSLARTPLQDEVVPPAAVRGLNLVDAVWPPQEKPRPEVLLYGLMSPAGCYTDFHVDFGGSSIWYHVVKGRKTFILVPPTPHNMKAFEEWSSSDRQDGIFYADRAEGCLQATLTPGSTLLIPSSWPHAVVTHEDAVVVGGNFLHALELRRAVECWEMESRLKVHASARFPLFEPLMWHTVAHYCKRLLPDDLAAELHCMPIAWELTGLMCVVSFLKRQMEEADWFYAPKSFKDPEGLLLQAEIAVAGLLPEDTLLDLFNDLDPLDPDSVGANPGDLLLDHYTSLLDDPDRGFGLPLPDVASPAWLDGMAKTSTDQEPAASSASQSEGSGEAADKGESSGEELTAGKRSRGSAAQRAKQQRLDGLRAAKAAREKHKRRAAQAAARSAASKGEHTQQEGSAAPPQPVITLKASARQAQAARDGELGSKRVALKAQMMVLHLRSRIQKELSMQADAASGKLQLKDSGARLQEGISETAARLAQALSSLAQHSAAEPPWPVQCFQSNSLHFIDADGQVQGPFSAEHVKVLQASGAVQDDTLVMAAAKGPSLLKDVMQMYEKIGTSPPARITVEPMVAQDRPTDNGHTPNHPSSNGSSRAASHGSASLLRPGHTASLQSRDRHVSVIHSSKSDGSNRDHLKSRVTSRSGSSRASEAEEVQRKIEQARARRAKEQQRQEEARRRAFEEHRSRAAQVAAQRHQSKSSWAGQAASELAEAELASDGAYQGTWTFVGSKGQEMGPYSKSELIAMHESGQIDDKIMVYDEEDGVTMELAALANTAAKSGHSLSPGLAPVPDAGAQQPDEASQPGVGGLPGSAERQLHSALDGDQHMEQTAPQATPSVRPRSPRRSTGQYLPGLAPATEVRKRAAELREQHLAKLRSLAGGRGGASSGAAAQLSGPADDGMPPPPPPLPLELMDTSDAPALWQSAAVGPAPAGGPPAVKAALTGEPLHAALQADLSSAGLESTRREPDTTGLLKPHDSSSVAPSAIGSTWWQQEAHHEQQGQHFGHHQGSQAGQHGSSWQGSGSSGPQQRHLGQQGTTHGGWHGLAKAQAFGAESMGHAGQPGNLGSMLQGIMTSVHSNAGLHLAHHDPSPGQGGWSPHGTPQNPKGDAMTAGGQPTRQIAGAVQHPEAALPYNYVHPQQPSQYEVVGHPWYGR